MATKKAASTKKKAPTKKSAATKTTIRTVSSSTKSAKTTEAKSTKPTKATGLKIDTKLPKNIINIIFAELVGTFILTLVALTAFSDGSIGALAAGFTLMALVMGIGAISGGHVNPIVTFGLWTMRKLKTVLVPFYWGAQFIGAMLASIVSNWIVGGGINFSFQNFSEINWTVFGAELVGSAVFLFIVAAVVSSKNLTDFSKAAGIGLALTVGVLTSGFLFTAAKTHAIQEYTRKANTEEVSSIPELAFVRKITLNPAVALATVDFTESELTTGSPADSETPNSRFNLEVILGTLLGAALGGNLYLLIAGRQKKS